jgi:hypothetical protein
VDKPWAHLKIRNARPAVSREAVEALSRKLGLSLPAAYVEFLLASNGGSFHPWPMYPIDDCPRDASGLLHVLFNVGTGDSVDLAVQHGIHRGRMPAELLPVGSDPGGNLICLACAGERAGQVFFWERAFEADPDAGQEVGWGNVFRVAESFPAFLRGLRVEAEPGAAADGGGM